LELTSSGHLNAQGLRGVQITQTDLIQSEIIVKKLLQAINHCGNAGYLSDRQAKMHDERISTAGITAEWDSRPME
jgi:hypothetical protein